MQKIDEYVKVAQAAEILGVAENTVRRWADLGKLTATRNPANGYRLFHKKHLEKFLKRAAERSTKSNKFKKAS